MINSFKKVIWYTIEGTCTVLMYILKYIPGTQEVINEEVRKKRRLLKLIPDQKMCNEVVEKRPWMLHHVPLCFKTHEMCFKVVENYYPPRFIPDHLKTQEKSKKPVEKYPYNLKAVTDHFKTQEMCEKSVENKPETLEYIPHHLKTEEMCNEVVRREPYKWL